MSTQIKNCAGQLINRKLVLTSLLLTVIFPIVSCCLLAAPLCLPATASAMVPKNLTVSKPNSNSVCVNITGPKNSYISCEVFSNALVETLVQSGLFSSVARTNEDYRLDVRLVELKLPKMTYTRIAILVTRWHLVRVLDSAVMANEYISAPFVTTAADAFANMKRTGLAMEGAGRSNIAEGTRRLSLVLGSGNVPWSVSGNKKNQVSDIAAITMHWGELHSAMTTDDVVALGFSLDMREGSSITTVGPNMPGGHYFRGISLHVVRVDTAASISDLAGHIYTEPGAKREIVCNPFHTIVFINDKLDTWNPVPDEVLVFGE